MKLSEITAILGQAAIVFPNVTLQEATFRAWFKLFEAEDAQKFHAAMLALVKEAGRKFFPTPGEVTEILQRMNDGGSAPGDLWEHAIHLASHGLSVDRMTEEMTKKSARAARALRSIGWDRVRHTDLSDLHYVRRDFIEAMKSYEQHEHEQSTKLEAAGILARIEGSISGKNRGGLDGLRAMVGQVPALRTERSNGSLLENETQPRRAIS